MKKHIGALLLVITYLTYGSTLRAQPKYTIPAEFEQQEYIWLSWIESGFLGGEPFYLTALDAMKAITPYAKIRLFFGPQGNYNKTQMEKRIRQRLIDSKIDTSRVTLFYNEKAYGAIQDPGPVFLKDEVGNLAIADFKFIHPDLRSEAIDRNVARQLHLPTIAANIISEGGAWQTNGKGTMILVEAVELARNKTMNRQQIENAYKKVLGISKFIWLKKGMREEEWGKLENGIYGIGTGGHIDEFCRFVNDSTVLLAAIDPADTAANSVSRESYLRMEENFQILNQSTTADGKPIHIIRLPAGPLITKKMAFKRLTKTEQYWFDKPTTDSVEFYLATGYMNFIIANDVVVTAKFWKPGLLAAYARLDKKAFDVLQEAFPGRAIIQIDCMPLHHDGAGLHCHSRNQPFKN